MKKKKGLVITAVVLIIGAFITIAVVNSSKTKEASAKSGVKVDTTLVTTGTIEAKVTVKGSIQPFETRKIYSPVVGKIDTLYVNEGDQVKKDDSLLAFDADDIEKMQNKYRQAEINKKIQDINNDSTASKLKGSVDQARQSVSQLDITIKESRIALKDARKTLTNNQALFESGAISKSQLDGSKKAVDALERKLSLEESSLTNAKTQLANSQKDYMTALSADPETSVQQLQLELQQLSLEELQKSIKDLKDGIKAPIQGTVLSIESKEGLYVNNTVPIMTIGDLTKKMVTVAISEFDAPLLAIDQNVTVRSNALNGKKYDAKVTAVGAQAVKTRQGNSEVQTVKAEITILDDAKELKPGYSVNCDIILDKKEDIIVVPIQSTLKDKEDNYYVYVVNDENKVEKKIIEIGLFSELIIEADGIEKDTQIIMSPSPLIKEGDTVTPVLKEDTEGAETDDKN